MPDEGATTPGMAAAEHHHPADLVSITEAAKRLGVTPRTVQRWVAQGKLPVYTLSARSRYVIWSEIGPELTANAQANPGGKSATIGGNVHPIGR